VGEAVAQALLVKTLEPLQTLQTKVEMAVQVQRRP
jgi:hypothetical protein